jgi:hypothetical protein
VYYVPGDDPRVDDGVNTNDDTSDWTLGIFKRDSEDQENRGDLFLVFGTVDGEAVGRGDRLIAAVHEAVLHLPTGLNLRNDNDPRVHQVEFWAYMELPDADQLTAWRFYERLRGVNAPLPPR